MVYEKFFNNLRNLSGCWVCNSGSGAVSASAVADADRSPIIDSLSLAKEIIRKSKIFAAQKETSVSKLLADSLVRIVQQEDFYEASKRNGLQAMKKGFHLGGVRSWKREDLYER